MDINLEQIWEEYHFFEIDEKLANLFPETSLDLKELFLRILGGDVLGACKDALFAVKDSFFNQFSSMREMLLMVVILGILAALISHFIEVFNNHQIADMGFYFTYLLLIAVLMKTFLTVSTIADGTINRIVEFVKLFIPAYLLSVGVATGSLTAASGYQIVLLVIFVIEQLLKMIILPLIYSYVLLSVINGVWLEEKLSLMVEGIEKVIRFLLKASLGIITGISALQSMITPAIDSVKATALQKTVSAIPGVGDVADGVWEVVIGSAVVIKNGIGLLILLLLLVLFATPMLQLLLTSFLLKVAAAFLGIISDKRITSCTDKVGNGSQLLFKATGTSLLLFMITISVAAYTTNRGF